MKFDEAYIRESVLYPQTKIVAGYDDIMPTFKGLLTEDGLLKVVAYVKSLGPANGTQTPAAPGSTMTTATEQQAPAQPRTAPRPGAVGNR